VETGVGLSLLAAIVASAFYGCAPAVQAVVARREPTGRGLGWRLLLRLATRPLWLLAFSGEVIGFGLEAYAFSVAPATLVAPIMACDLIFFVLVATWIFHERLSRQGIVGVAAMSTGVGLLALAFSGHDHLGEPASDALMLTFLVSCLVVSGIAAGVGSGALARGRQALAAVLFSAAAGASYGLATMAIRQVGRTFSPDDPWHLLATATPYTLTVCSLIGIAMMQRGLQTSSLLAFPVTSATGAVLPVILGATLLGDEVPTGAGRTAFVAALVLIVGGVILLGNDRATAAASSALVSNDQSSSRQRQNG
jgi:drug/metabolite transporter (DMT)-like permease